MSNLTDFLPYIEDQVPGCSIPRMTRAIREGVIDFCQRTQWWKENLAATIPLVAAQKSYTLTPPTDADISKPIRVTINGRTVTLREKEYLDRYRLGWESDTDTASHPLFFFTDAPGSIRVVPFPNTESVDEGLEMLVRVSLKPTRTATVVDDRFYNEALEAVQSAALKRLFATAAPWGNSARLKEEKRAFEDFVAEFIWRNITGDGEQIVTAQVGGFAEWDTKLR